MSAVELPLKHPELFSGGLRRRSGVLLYGPPGQFPPVANLPSVLSSAGLLPPLFPSVTGTLLAAALCSDILHHMAAPAQPPTTQLLATLQVRLYFQVGGSERHPEFNISC